MKSTYLAIAAAIASLALAGCGETQDASADAMADNVEVPADDAMNDTPMPVEETSVVEDSAEDAAPATDEVEQSAEQAADDAQSAVDDAVSAAEDSME